MALLDEASQGVTDHGRFDVGVGDPVAGDLHDPLGMGAGDVVRGVGHRAADCLRWVVAQRLKKLDTDVGIVDQGLHLRPPREVGSGALRRKPAQGLIVVIDPAAQEGAGEIEFGLEERADGEFAGEVAREDFHRRE